MRTHWNVSLCSRSNLNLEVLVFKERGNLEYPEKTLSEQGTEPTTNSTHIWRWHRDLNPRHISAHQCGASGLITVPPLLPGGNFEHVLPCNSYCIFSFSLPYLLINFMLKPTKTKFISHSYFTTQKRGEVIRSCCYGGKISGSQQTMLKKGKCFELSPYWEMFGNQLELLSLLLLFLLLLLVELKWIFNHFPFFIKDLNFTTP